jgi:hypothetical protein
LLKTGAWSSLVATAWPPPERDGLPMLGRPSLWKPAFGRRLALLTSEAVDSLHIHELAVTVQISFGQLGLLTNPAVLIIIGVVFAAVFVGVVLPAVWSRKKTRRTSALDVLDRILPWKR